MLLCPALAPAAAPTVDAHELARTLVEIGGERQREAKALEPMEALVSNLVDSKLSLTDPSATAKVKSVVHDAFAPVSVRAGDAMIDAYATNFTGHELGEVLAFMKSPAAETEKVNLPLLSGELSAALAGLSSNTNVEVDAMRVYDSTSPAKRELILRILKAEDFEAHTREGYAKWGAMMRAALKQVANNPQNVEPSYPQTAEDERAADAYVRLVTAVEKRYYADHFSEIDLSAIATYLESNTGQAILVRQPKVKRAVEESLADQLVIALGSLDKNVCATVPCTPEQRASVADFTRSMATSIPAIVGAATK
jgi:hypothetical protein